MATHTVMEGSAFYEIDDEYMAERNRRAAGGSADGGRKDGKKAAGEQKPQNMSLRNRRMQR